MKQSVHDDPPRPRDRSAHTPRRRCPGDQAGADRVWGTIHHLQTQPGHRNEGIGSALMYRLRHVARDEMDLEQLHLAARGGTGLENFYARLGWREVGRWPAKLRFAPADTRDEIMMILTPL